MSLSHANLPSIHTSSCARPNPDATCCFCVQVYPAVGPDATLQLVQQGLAAGGPSYVDFVMVAPDFLQARGAARQRLVLAPLGDACSTAPRSR
jgi:hypothetical protein